MPGLARDVVRSVPDHCGRAGRNRRDYINHRGQRLVIDDDALRGIARLVGGRRDDRRDRLADEAHALDGERVTRWRRSRRPIGAPEICRVGNRPDACAQEIGAGQYRDHARHCGRILGVDAKNVRVRMRRTHEARVQLALNLDVVGEKPLPAQQRVVFDTLH